jgi:hypothetical protein
MGKSHFELYLEMLQHAGLNYTTKHRETIASEELEGNSITIAEFDIDENLVDLMTISDFNSLDEVKNLWQST